MTEEPEDIKAMNEKIAAIKAKHEESEPQNVASRYGVGMQIVIELVSGIVVGAGIGYILDEIFDFQIIFLLSFTILGGFAGMLNISRYLKENIHNK